MNLTTPLLSAAGLRALTLAAAAVTLGSPAVIAQIHRDEQEARRRQIPVRLVKPGESASPVRQGRRNIPVRLVRPGETVSPMSATAPSADTSAAAMVFADQPIDGKRTAATRTNTPPVLDGRIDEAAWELADVVSDFVQKDPVNGAAPTKRTEVRVLYDDDTLYIGWINFDDEPNKIVANDMRRDATMGGEDYVAVFFDTFRDRRNAFGFQVNALGAKFDYTLTDESQLNMNWDETWEAAASITERGWEAELAIPFAALRYPTGSNVWGVEFEREVAYNKERINWNNTSRDYNWLAVSQYGNLVGLQNLALTDRFRLKPFVTGGYDSFQQRDNPLSEGRGDIGLE